MLLPLLLPLLLLLFLRCHPERSEGPLPRPSIPFRFKVISPHYRFPPAFAPTKKRRSVLRSTASSHSRPPSVSQPPKAAPRPGGQTYAFLRASLLMFSRFL